jgi:hypothetical protein
VTEPAAAAVDEELPRLTRKLLRDAERLCGRRLRHEHLSHRKPMRGSAVRFEVSNRFVADARLAHAEPGPPRPEAFVVPQECFPEQQWLYRAAVAGYLDRFGDTPGVAVDLGFSSSIEELGVQLVGDVGLAVETPDGGRELRVLRFGGSERDRTLVDAVELRFLLLRTRDWAPQSLRVVAADLVEATADVYVPDLGPERAAAGAWLEERAAVVAERAERAEIRPGGDCRECPVLAGCPAHRWS